MFFPRIRTYFKNLNSLKFVKYHLYKNLFRLTPKNVGSYLRVFTVSQTTRWKTRGGLRGMENTGYGEKYEASVENTGEPLFRPTMKFPHENGKQNFCYFNCLNSNENQFSILAWNALFDHKRKLNILCKWKSFKCQRAVEWFSFSWVIGASILFFEVTWVDFFYLWKRNKYEIIKIVLLCIVSHETAFLYK